MGPLVLLLPRGPSTPRPVPGIKPPARPALVATSDRMPTLPVTINSCSWEMLGRRPTLAPPGPTGPPRAASPARTWAPGMLMGAEAPATTPVDPALVKLKAARWDPGPRPGAESLGRAGSPARPGAPPPSFGPSLLPAGPPPRPPLSPAATGGSAATGGTVGPPPLPAPPPVPLAPPGNAPTESPGRAMYESMMRKGMGPCLATWGSSHGGGGWIS